MSPDAAPVSAPVPALALNAAGEAEWLRVERHLDLAEPFALIFFFSDLAAAARIFRDRLAAFYGVRACRLACPAPETPDALLDGLLPRLLRPEPYLQSFDAPIWLDLTQVPPDLPGDTAARAAAWRRARLDFLMRLNEQREPLRRTVARPLILVLPREEKVEIRTLCPDLWAIRQFAAETGDWIAAPLAERLPPIAESPEQMPEPFPLTEGETSLVLEWQRLRDRGAGDPGSLVAAARAYEALLRRGRLDSAAEVADWALRNARALVARLPGDAEALRLLGVAADDVGQIEQTRGRWGQARSVYRECLEIARQLISQVGETPQALHDLSVSLNNVGLIEASLGRPEQARAAHAESLEIRRRLLAEVGETPQALRDLSVSLNKVGGIEALLGRSEQARAAYAESLEIRRRLLAEVGETPQALRDLSVSLLKVGGIDALLGRSEQARAAYAESLEIRRRLLAQVGEIPQTLRDLCLSLGYLARTAYAQGDPESARAALAEALPIAERLAAALPDQVDYRGLPGWLRRLSTGLDDGGSQDSEPG